MPRTARAAKAGIIYHVLNRGNGRMRLFHDDRDFAAFERVLGEALKRYPVDLLTYCLMGNHWHLVLRPRADDALGRFMGWVGVTHVRRHHAHHGSSGGGHLYQGRFKSFPVQDDGHLLTLCRYVEGNAQRARLVAHAVDWPWGGMFARAAATGRVDGDAKPFALTEWPVDRPRNWAALVDRPLRDPEAAAVRTSVNRGRPFGDEQWVLRTARKLGLTFTLRPRGRPRKKKE